MRTPKALASTNTGGNPKRPVLARWKESAAKAMRCTTLSLPSGASDEGLLQGASQRPINKQQYEITDTFGCAAAYAFSISKAHAFVNGNRIIAFVISVTSLCLNGQHFVTEPTQTVVLVEDLAWGVVSEEKRKNWLEQNSSKI